MDAAVSWSTLSPFMQLGYEPILIDCDPKFGYKSNHLNEVIKEKISSLILVHVLSMIRM